MSEEIKERIADLMKINVSHQNLNAELRKEISYLRDRVEFYLVQLDTLKSENRKLRDLGKDFIDQHRNKGDM
tara:strand:- start:817 stop:1032 length:216 start_codon:yes stop_codon:yes gene_type:complete